MRWDFIGGIGLFLAGLLAVLLGRRPRRPEEAIRGAAVADERERVLDEREALLEVAAAKEQAAANEARAEADAVDPSDAQAIADLMNGGAS